VPWDQDLTICVAARRDTPAYGPWTRKAGVWHVQPPVDDCGESNGALRVLPGTHKSGRLTGAQIAEEHRKRRSVVCDARAGDVLLTRPLLTFGRSSVVHALKRAASY